MTIIIYDGASTILTKHLNTFIIRNLWMRIILAYRIANVKQIKLEGQTLL